MFDELGKTSVRHARGARAAHGARDTDRRVGARRLGPSGPRDLDLDKGVYRKRELTRDPLPMDKLRFSNPREEAAAKMVARGKIADQADSSDGGLVLAGRVKDKDRTFAPKMTFDTEQRLVQGECTCDYYGPHNKLHRGPCEHMLALRAAHRRGIDDTIDFKPVATTTSWGRATTQTDASRENFQAAFRKAVTRAAELRAQGRRDDSILELERVTRLAPPNSNELGGLAAIAEAKYEPKTTTARSPPPRSHSTSSRRAASRCGSTPTLVRSGLVSTAIPVARNLCTIENTAESAGTSSSRCATASRIGRRC